MGSCCYRNKEDTHGLAQNEGMGLTARPTATTVKGPEPVAGTDSTKHTSSQRPKVTSGSQWQKQEKGKVTNLKQSSFKTKRVVPDMPQFPITTKQLKKPFSQKFNLVKVENKAPLGKFLLAKVRKDDLYYLVKKVPRNKKGSEQLQESQFHSEIVATAALDHPNILQYQAVLYDDDFYYAVTEPVVSSQFLLAEEVAEMRDEKLAASVVTQVLEAVGYCHSLGVTHGSIGPHSLLLIAFDKETIQVKVAGFGAPPWERFVNDLRHACMYSAPEAFAREVQQSSDVWSCGVLLYYLLCANLPFRADRAEDFRKAVENYSPQFLQQYWTSANPLMKELIRSMLRSDAKQRISASDCLSHPCLLQHSSPSSSLAKPLSFALANLKRFPGGQRLKFTVLSFVATHATSAEQKQSLIDVFRSIDFDHDGVLNAADLTKAYLLVVHETAGEQVAALIANRVIEKVDLNADGSIDFSEFMMAASDHRSLLATKNLQTAFEMFDIDMSGGVSVEEMKETLKCEGSEEQWKQLMAEADEDGDGVVSFKEFAVLVRKAVAEGKHKAKPPAKDAS